MPALPDFQDHPLPWVTEREYVFDAHRVVIADFDCDQDEARAHALARFIAAAPETAEKLQDTTEKLRDLVKEVDRALLALGEFGWSGRYDALRAAADHARGA